MITGDWNDGSYI